MREVPEWIGATDDAVIPPRVRLRVFTKHNGICPKCTRPLRPKHWDCDHIVALANDGQHRESNLQPLCDSPCHSNKTKDDRRMQALTNKRRKTNAGIKSRRRSIPGRKFDGTPIPARWIE